MNKFTSEIIFDSAIFRNEYYFYIKLNNLLFSEDNVLNPCSFESDRGKTSKYTNRTRGKRETFRKTLIKHNIRYISSKEKQKFYRLLEEQKGFYYKYEKYKEKEYRKQENKKIADKLINF